MNKKIRILVTDTAPLYPPLWGGPKRIWYLYSNLPQDKFEIDYVGMDWRIKRYEVRRLKSNFREFILPLPSKYKYWFPIHKLFFKNLNLDLFLYFLNWLSEDFCYLLNTLKADIVISSHPWSSLCINRKNVFMIYEAHNCEYFLMRELTSTCNFKYIINGITKLIENRACKKSKAIIACSQEDKKLFESLYSVRDKKICVIPNGAIVRPSISRKEKVAIKERLGIMLSKPVVLFVGAYYKPNIEAVEFIVSKLSSELGECLFLIAGKVGDYFKKRNKPSNVLFTGELSEKKLDEVFKCADIGINPVEKGGGINIKVLDYLSYGLPVISTSTGVRGIRCKDKQQVYISSLGDFAFSIREVLRDKELFEKLSEEGRHLIFKYYNWHLLSLKLASFLEKRMQITEEDAFDNSLHFSLSSV